MTEPRRSGCPDANMLAEYIDGGLDPRQRADIEAHLADCEECYEVFADALAQGSAQAPAGVTSRSWRPAVAAAALLLVTASLFWWFAMRDRSPVSAGPLASALRGVRTLEPRLSGGVPWAALDAVSRGANDFPPDLEIAVAELRKHVADGRTAERLAGLGAGQAAVHRFTDAIAALREATALDGTRAEWWSDLSAAYQGRAAFEANAEDWPRALEAAERALALNETLPEALFNRALAQEQLGLKQGAIDTWKRLLTIAPNDGWRTEAEQRLRRLETPKAAVPDLQSLREGLMTSELPRWAAAPAGQASSAIAASVETLAANRDTFAADLGRAVDRIPAATLADFGNAHTHYVAGRFAEAKRGYARIATAASGPAQWPAMIFAAVCDYMAGDLDAADRTLGTVERAMPTGYIALRGRTAWVRGLIRSQRGRRREAVEYYERAEHWLDDAGELRNAAFVRQLRAEQADVIGDPHQSWPLRIAAMQVSDRTDLFTGAAWSARLYGWPLAALRFQAEALAAARRSGVSRQVTNATLDLALSLYAAGRRAEARTLLDDARRALPAETGPSRTLAEFDLATARCAPGGDLTAGLAAADRAVDFFQRESAGRLPDALVARARLRALTGNPAGAEADAAAAGTELERESAMLHGTWTTPMAERMRAIADFRVELAVAGACAPCALDAAEAGRRRLTDGRLDTVVASRAVPPDVVAHYFWVLDDAVIHWTVRAGAVTLARRAISKTEVTRLVTSWNADPASPAVTDEVRARLFGGTPVVPDGVSMVAIVPDDALYAAPFAALIGRDANTPLLLAPSLSRLVAPPPALSPSMTVAALGAGTFDRRAHPDLPALGGVPRELDAVASAVRTHARVTVSPQAGPETLLRALREVAVVHFAGHGTVDFVRPERSALVTAAANDGDVTAAVLASTSNVRARLVVLSACRTGGGVITRGDGPLSIAHALERAGVGAVVGSMWPVRDDVAIAFASAFHTALAATGDAVAALSAARAALRHSTDATLSRPEAWAGYFITGTLSARSMFTPRRPA